MTRGVVVSNSVRLGTVSIGGSGRSRLPGLGLRLATAESVAGWYPRTCLPAQTKGSAGTFARVTKPPHAADLGGHREMGSANAIQAFAPQPCRYPSTIRLTTSEPGLQGLPTAPADLRQAVIRIRPPVPAEAIASVRDQCANLPLNFIFLMLAPWPRSRSRKRRPAASRIPGHVGQTSGCWTRRSATSACALPARHSSRASGNSIVNWLRVSSPLLAVGRVVLS